MHTYMVCDNITLTFHSYEMLQEWSILRRLNGKKMKWYNIAQLSGNSRRVNKMMVDGLAGLRVQRETLLAIHARPSATAPSCGFVSLLLRARVQYCKPSSSNKWQIP